MGAPQQRGAAACAFFDSAGSSDPLADAKRRVFSSVANGFAPFLDPLEAVSYVHLAQIAIGANLSDEQLEEMVQQINTELGWDIRQGLPNHPT